MLFGELRDKESVTRKKVRYWLNRIKKLDRNGLLFERSEYVDKAYTRTGYVVDRRVFKWAWRVFFVALFFIAYSHGWTASDLIIRPHVSCVAPYEGYVGEGCDNPYYMNCPYKSRYCDQLYYLEKLPVGYEIGGKEDGSAAPAFGWLFFVTGVGLVWNHYKYNKGKLPFQRR
jgi:hypothetical protein